MAMTTASTRYHHQALKVLGKQHTALLVQMMHTFQERMVGTYLTYNRPIGLLEPAEHAATFSQDDVVCDHRCGGILKSYRWKQAA